MLDSEIIRQCLLIRRVEETFLEMFSQGRLNGTVHTCVGQEMSAAAFAGALKPGDFIFSNHRCHGHFIARTGDVRGLIAELMGKAEGVCGGVGSSQHLCKGEFFSNGIQGGITPVAAGYALAHKLRGADHIGTVFIGDGTLGEGVVYETLNIISQWSIPLLVVCENNEYAQSTLRANVQAGDIAARAQAFGVATFHSNTFDPEALLSAARESIDRVRREQRPVFHLVDTYRLNAHSKSDDDRDPAEIARFAKQDPLNVFKEQHPEEYNAMLEDVNREISDIVAALDGAPELPVSDYLDVAEEQPPVEWKPLPEIDKRQVHLLYDFFDTLMAEDERVVFLGEDVAAPYGGAFKVSRDLSEKHPERVLSMPISEAAICGLANGLALNGMRPFAEIMFGDFMTLCMDQLVNHASKFHHMYNKQVTCPVVLRTPMGGRRGYGPTHSQSLDKFLTGIDNVTTVALNSLLDPRDIYRSVHAHDHPVVVIENKLDYGRTIGGERPPRYVFEKSAGDWPVVRIRPEISQPTATLVTYGGMADIVVRCLAPLFSEMDVKAEILLLSRIHPLDCRAVIDSVRTTGALFVIEEGNAFTGMGSEIIAAVAEALDAPFTARRIAKQPVAIPSARSLEDNVLPGVDAVLESVKEALS